MIHKKEYLHRGKLSIFIGGLYPFLANLMNLAKTQIPRVGLESYPIKSVLYSDNWSLRFSVR